MKRLLLVVLAGLLSVGASCPKKGTSLPGDPTSALIASLVESVCPKVDPIGVVLVCAPLVTVAQSKQADAALVQCVINTCAGVAPSTPMAAPPSPSAPVASPTVALTATPTAPIGPTPTPQVRKIPSNDFDAPKQYENDVRKAMRIYQQRHPDQFDPTDPHILLFKDGQGHLISQDDFLWGVAGILGQLGYDAFDDYPSGDLAVSLSATKIGDGFAEQYHPISSDRRLQDSPYRHRSTPKWFEFVGPGPGVAPTSAPVATAPPVVSSYVPPLADRWRGCEQSNTINGFCDTTQIFYCPMMGPSIGGARSCDASHNITLTMCCGGRSADDPRGPRFKVTLLEDGPVTVRQPCRNGNWHNACFDGPTGSVAMIDTCADVGDLDIVYDPADPATDCPHGRIPLVTFDGSDGCYGARRIVL